MKRYLFMLLSLFMLIGMTVTVSASNEVWVSSDSGSPGDEVTVSVSLGRFFGIASLKMSLEYDANNMTLTNIRYSDTLPGECQMPQTYNNPSVMNWYDTKNFNGNSDFAVLTFEIHEDAAAGDYDIVLGIYQKETFGYGADGSVIPYEFPIPHNGVITVEGGNSDYTGVTEIKLDTASLELEVGERKMIETEVYPASAPSALSWYSSEESIAVVDENGTVRAIGAGTATITARADNVSASCRVRVEKVHTHVYNETIPTSEFRASYATCASKAAYYYSCECTDTSSRTFTYGNTLDHTFGEWETVTEPTETSEGLAESVCTSCQKAKETKILPITGHTHTYDQKITLYQYLVIRATCEEKAVYYFSCECGEAGQKTFEAGNLSGHTMLCHEAREATCESAGNKLYYECDVCDKFFTDCAGTEETTIGEVTLNKTAHTDQNIDNVCDICGEIKSADEDFRLYGDVNGDGLVNTADSTFLNQYFAGHSVTINEENADVNGDGSVTRADAMILARHVENWTDYAILPYKD